MVIEVMNVSKTYNSRKKESTNALEKIIPFLREKTVVKVLDNISFTIRKGECVGLIGHNGAGKSTLIKIMTGIVSPTKGSVKLFGYDSFTHRKQNNKKIAAVFGQRVQLKWDLPANDSFEILTCMYGVPKEIADERIQHYAQLFDCVHKLSQPLRTLSLGERMKVEVIASLIHDPEIIFFDEPTIGMDVVTKEMMKRVIHTLVNEGKTIILTSHDMDDVQELCQRVIVLNDGVIVIDDEMRSVLEKNGNRTLVIKYKKMKKTSFEKWEIEAIIDEKQQVIKIVQGAQDVGVLLAYVQTFVEIADVTFQNDTLEYVISNLITQ